MHTHTQDISSSPSHGLQPLAGDNKYTGNNQLQESIYFCDGEICFTCGNDKRFGIVKVTVTPRSHLDIAHLHQANITTKY